MKDMDVYKHALEISDIHADRLQMAISKLQHLIPLDAKKILNISEIDFLNYKILLVIICLIFALLMLDVW